MTDFPVLAAVSAGIASAATGFWLAFTKFSDHVNKQVSESERRCKEEINGLKEEIKDIRSQLLRCRGATSFFVDIINLTRKVTDEHVAAEINDKAEEGLKVLR